MVQFIKETNSILRTIVLGAYIIAIVFCLTGIWFIYLGAKGSTEFFFFGQSFSSTNVGISALFLGAAVAVLLIRRSLRTLDNTIRAESSFVEKDLAPLEHWPKKKTRETLEHRMKTLSHKQKHLLNTIIINDGVFEYSIVNKSEDFHRLNTLEQEELITRDENKIYLTATVKKLLEE